MIGVTIKFSLESIWNLLESLINENFFQNYLDYFIEEGMEEEWYNKEVFLGDFCIKLWMLLIAIGGVILLLMMKKK